MVNHFYSGHIPQELNSLLLAKTYRHSLALRQWLLRKERSFETFEQQKKEFFLQ